MAINLRETVGRTTFLDNQNPTSKDLFSGLFMKERIRGTERN